ncbi:MAG TPA: hypothetical protein VG603_10320 [Chitinophagales bacterium]|nr:hypothetical protein [Chitinophagales bacterium]
MKRLLPAFLMLFAFAANAQYNGVPMHDDLSEPLSQDSVVPTLKRIDKILNILREFRFQAYIQPEWQRADTTGVTTTGPLGTTGVGAFQGGTFPAASNNRFILRRGRFKFSFEHKNGKDLKIIDFAFQFDATERGFFIKDFYGRIIDPWIGWFGLQGGVFARPFGYETPSFPAFSESPEFAAVNQAIMPNEVELGEALVIESPAKFEPVYLRVDASIVNGQGIGVGLTNQTGSYQSRKDFIGRIKVGRSWDLGKARVGLNGSVSYYYGGVLQTTNYVFEYAKDSTGQAYYKNIASPKDVLKKIYKREYYGANLEFKADYNIGTTTLRGEFIAGQQPGGATSSSVPLGQINSPPISDLYLRHFMGASVLFDQAFKVKLKNHTMMNDITVKYDFYDPQAQVKGTDLALLRGFSITDIKYSTLGVGYTFTPYNWFKLIVWYDHVMNEKASIPGFASDYKKDDVLTIRTQFYVDSWWFTGSKSKYRDNLMLKKY